MTDDATSTELKPIDVMDVVVGACTFRRHDDLRALLASVALLKIDPSINLSILIVDNDKTPSAEPVVLAAQQTMPWPLRYVHEPESGISCARNRVLSEAGDSGFLAFLDDDETVDPLWLDRLVAAQRATGATFVQGPVEMTVRDDADAWWLDSAFFVQNTFDHLAPISESWTNNVLIDLEFVSRHAIQFDLSLRFEGGEDTLFFQDIVAKGGTGRFAKDAIVYEVQNPDRLRWKWGILRQYRYGITRANTALLRRAKPAAVLYCVVRGTAMIGLGLVKSVLFFIFGRTAGIALLSRGSGVFMGLFGATRQDYGK
jgi:succinoglycan biosynthesis protein ExoM